jgi:hypothetical protein
VCVHPNCGGGCMHATLSLLGSSTSKNRFDITTTTVAPSSAGVVTGSAGALIAFTFAYMYQNYRLDVSRRIRASRNHKLYCR